MTRDQRPRCKRCRAPLVIPAKGRPPVYCGNTCRCLAYQKRKRRSAHFKRYSCEWSTPQDFFDELDAEFRFTLDVCATAENAKYEEFYTRDQDGLVQLWTGRAWCNPPYGRGVGCWLAKAYQVIRSGEAELVVCLVHARTDTLWWHEWYRRADAVQFVRRRLRFNGADSAPFPSVLMLFVDPRLAGEVLPALDKKWCIISRPSSLTARE